MLGLYGDNGNGNCYNNGLYRFLGFKFRAQSKRKYIVGSR